MSVDVDMQPVPLPPSRDISGEWQIAGPFDTGALVTITLDAFTQNYTMDCNGIQGKCFAPQSGAVTADGRTYNGFNIPGTISPDNNRITWTNGVIFNRWWPAAEPTSQIAGQFMVFATGVPPTCLT